MCDNVTPIFEEEAPKKRISIKKQWLIFSSIVLLILVLLVWFLLSQTTVLDGVKRFFRYLGVDEDDYGSIRFEAYGNSSYAMVDEAFAVASQNGLQVFSEGGSRLLSVSGSFSNPMFEQNEELSLLCDLGGNRLVLFDGEGDVRFDKTTDGIIYDIDLCEEGICAVLYEGSDCHAVLDVFNAKGEKLYTHRSESTFLNTCALSPNGSYAVVSTLGQEDISFLSTARILTTRTEGIKANVSFGTEVICDMAFLSDDTICAVGEETLFFFDTDGNLEKSYVRENAKLASYCFLDERILALYDNYELSEGYDLICLDEDADKIAEKNLSAAPQYFSRCGHYVCVLTQESVLIYDNDLDLSSSTGNDAYIAALARSDGTALLIGNGTTALYIP